MSRHRALGGGDLLPLSTPVHKRPKPGSRAAIARGRAVCWVGMKVEAEGAITLPARLLADYVGLLSAGEPLELELKAKKAHLSCGRFEANISGIDAEEFPPIPSVSGGTSLKIAAPRLKEAIAQVVFAAAPDDSRPVLAGVLMTVSGGKLTLA